MIRTIIEQYIGSLVRHWLTFLAGLLVAQGIIRDGGASFVSTNYEVAMGLIAYAIGQGFSFAKSKKN